MAQDIEQRRKINGKAVCRELEGEMTGDAVLTEKMKYLLYNAPVDIRPLCSAANLPRWSLSSVLPEQKGEQNEPSWQEVMKLYALHGNAQDKLEGAVPVLEEGGDVVMTLEGRWHGGNMMDSTVFPCQIVPQDGGILVRQHCDIVFTPPLSGCAFFTCSVGGEQKMFHVNRPYDFRRMIPVAVHLWTPLSDAVRSEFRPKISELFNLAQGAEADWFSAADRLLQAGIPATLFPEEESAHLRGEFKERQKLIELISSTLLQCAKAWRMPEKQCWPVVQLAFVLSCESSLQSLAAVSPPYATAMSRDGVNIFQSLPVALRENGGFTLYMCPQLAHRPSPTEPFSIIKKGDPQAVSFTPPDFVRAFRELYDRKTGNMPVFDPNAILV